jgi:hypothetical protein
MMTRGGQNAFAFGRSLGQALEEIDWLLVYIEAYASEKGAKNLNLIVFRGLLSGHWERRPDTIEAFLNRVMGDAKWTERLVELQSSIHLSSEGWSRLGTAIRAGGEELASLNYLPIRPELTEQTISVYQDFIGSLIAAGSNGIAHAWQILGYLFHRDDAVAGVNSDRLTRVVINLILHTPWGDDSYRNGLRDHSISVVLEYLARYVQSSDVREMLAAILQTAPENHGYIRRDQLNYASAFFRNHTAEALDVLWEILGRRTHTYLKHEMEGLNSTTPSVVFGMVTEHLLNWCNRSPAERYLFASEICDLFEQNEALGRLVITDQALRLLNSAPDKRVILEVYFERFRPLPRGGSLHEILEARLGLFEDLRGDPDFEDIVVDAEREFRNDIIESRRFEAKRERAEAQSFE